MNSNSSNCYSSLNPFPIDLNQDDDHQHQHQHQLFSLQSQPSASVSANSSSSSFACPIFYNPPTFQQQAAAPQPAGYNYQIQRGPHGHQYYYFQAQEDQGGKIYVPQPQDHDVPILESKLSIKWKKEERVGRSTHHQSDHDQNISSAKWMMSSKRKMTSDFSTPKPEVDLKQMQQPSSSPDNSSSSNSNCYNINNNSNTIRVCSDCNTTKTPLWRSGPRGPKSLCNACGIRQRKARRAIAAAAVAAAANGTINVAADDETRQTMKKKKNNKGKRSSSNIGSVPVPTTLKNNKKCKLSSRKSQGEGEGESNKVCIEELRMILLSKNISAFHHGVFPQDDKEAAILLMALSYGHGSLGIHAST